MECGAGDDIHDIIMKGELGDNIHDIIMEGGVGDDTHDIILVTIFTIHFCECYY